MSVKIGSITVHYAIRDLSSIDQSAAMKSDRIALLRIGPEGLARRSLGARALIRTVLREQLGPDVARCPIVYEPHGRPIIVDHGEIGISISHSDRWVAVAMTTEARGLGIDIEMPREVSCALIERCCSKIDANLLHDMAPEKRYLEFTRMWTVKEACVKATGGGIADRPWTIPVGVDQWTGEWNGTTWATVRAIPIPISFAVTG